MVTHIASDSDYEYPLSWAASDWSIYYFQLPLHYYKLEELISIDSQQYLLY